MLQVHQQYMSAHPELGHMMSDFVQHMLLNKPEDVLAAAKQYFAAFAPPPQPQPPLAASQARETIADTAAAGQPAQISADTAAV